MTKSFLILSKNFLISRKGWEQKTFFCLTEITIIFTEIHHISSLMPGGKKKVTHT